MEPTVADLIRAEIDARGRITFERFMDLALYAPGLGYYTRSRDPFGVDGDFFTAEQIQPSFGILVAELIRPILNVLGSGTVVELGPGRGEMRRHFDGLEYIPVDVADPLPANFSGVIFCNEFFDALPVHLMKRVRGAWREQCVTWRDGSFVFAPRSAAPSPEVLAYLDRYHAKAANGSSVEVCTRMPEWVRRVTRSAGRAWWIIIDYGFTAREWIRHTHGTLLAYSHHRTTEAVLEDPGNRDLTAHVAWTPLQDELQARGWKIESFETLASVLLRAGQPSEFACVLGGCDAAEEARRRMQLKQLLFGMGETFRVLTASRGDTQ